MDRRATAARNLKQSPGLTLPGSLIIPTNSRKGTLSLALCFALGSLSKNRRMLSFMREIHPLRFARMSAGVGVGAEPIFA
jgi:hypothetical protein